MKNSLFWDITPHSPLIELFFSLPNLSSRVMALVFTQPLNRNEYQKVFLGSKALPTRKDNLTAICERNV
jgi:hypothetical protein